MIRPVTRDFGHQFVFQGYIVLEVIIGGKAEDAVTDAELGGSDRARGYSLDGTGNNAAQITGYLAISLSWIIWS
jgi:hypothetical protein